MGKLCFMWQNGRNMLVEVVFDFTLLGFFTIPYFFIYILFFGGNQYVGKCFTNFYFASLKWGFGKF